MKCRLLLVLLLCANQLSTAVAQSASPTPSATLLNLLNDRKRLDEEQKRLQRQQEIQNFVLRAGYLQTEVSADLFFSVLDAKLIDDFKKKVEIIEDMYGRSSSAKEPYKLRVYEGVVDTRSGYRSNAYSLGLDSLSIRLDLVRRMLPLDKIKARKLFVEIPDLKSSPLECEDDLGYDLSEYYSVLRTVVETSFDREGIQQGQDIYFASGYFESLHSPAQVGPVIDFLSSTRISGNALGQLVDSFTAGLRRIAVDPRSFASSLKYDRTTQKLWQALLPRLEQNGLQTTSLVKAYRTYALKQISSAQCSDFLMVSSEDKTHPAISDLENLTKVTISPEDTKPEQIKTASKPFLYWKTAKAMKLLEGIKKLRFGNSETALSPAERSSADWQIKLMKYLQEMDAWKVEDEETSADYLNQKSVLYDSLFELAPPGVLSTQILQAYAVFLRDSSIRKEAPGHWLFFVKRLFRMAKNLSTQEHSKFLDEVGRVGNDELSAYADLERFKLTPIPKAPGKKVGEKNPL